MFETLTSPTKVPYPLTAVHFNKSNDYVLVLYIYVGSGRSIINP